MKSPLLCVTLTNPEVSQYLQDERFIRLLQCFLDPHQYMIKQDDEAEKMLYRSRGQHCVQEDPIYKLFDPDNTKKLGTQCTVHDHELMQQAEVHGFKTCY